MEEIYREAQMQILRTRDRHHQERMEEYLRMQMSYRESMIQDALTSTKDIERRKRKNIGILVGELRELRQCHTDKIN